MYRSWRTLRGSSLSLGISLPRARLRRTATLWGSGLGAFNEHPSWRTHAAAKDNTAKARVLVLRIKVSSCCSAEGRGVGRANATQNGAENVGIHARRAFMSVLRQVKLPRPPTGSTKMA